MQKCPGCGHEGDEGACPVCQLPMEPKCEMCEEAESNCTCEANVADEEEEVA